MPPLGPKVVVVQQEPIELPPPPPPVPQHIDADTTYGFLRKELIQNQVTASYADAMLNALLDLNFSQAVIDEYRIQSETEVDGTYFGQTVGNKKHGRGIMYLTEGKLVAGDWTDDAIRSGCIITPDG
jgi:hypothetical protein